MKRTAAAFVLLAACVVPSGCGHGDTENQANVAAPPPTVVVATVRRESVPISEDYEGAFGSIESVEVRARVEGTLDSAPFKEGDLVRKGDLMFRIQQSEYIAALQAAQAQLAQARRQSYSPARPQSHVRIPRSRATGHSPRTRPSRKKISTMPFKTPRSPRATCWSRARRSRRLRQPSTTRRSTWVTRRSALRSRA